MRAPLLPPADAEARAFLGVARSVTGRSWRGPNPSVLRAAEAIAQATGHSDILCRILAQRGIGAQEAGSWLAPTLRDLLPDPSSLHDMDAAAERFTRAAARGERVAIFADYDVDGAASAALLTLWLRAFGIEPTLYVPDRLTEGYGPNVPAMQQLGAAHELIVCVDCGTLALGPIAAAACDVLVLDHHQAGPDLPAARAVVNPNRLDEEAGLGHLCAAGVVFLMLIGANRLMRRDGREVPDLLALLDLVALATVADVAPLVGLNRAFVRQGLAVMAGGMRPGLTALAGHAGLKGPATTFALGFVLGPRINAGGRVGTADLGARLLAAEDAGAAAALAGQLEDLNRARRAIEAEVRADAEAQVDARGGDGPLVWAAGTDWHPGVVGIVAARLKERFARPAVVIGIVGETGTGSARSVAGVDLGAAVARLAAEGLIARGGGHAMAAGLSVSRGRIEAAMARLAELLSEAGPPARVAPTLDIVGPVGIAASTATAHEIALAGPFGAGAPTPLVAVAEARLRSARRVGDGHLALDLSQDAGARLRAIAFRAFEGPLGPWLEGAVGTRIHLAGRLEPDGWAGRDAAKLQVEDAAAAPATREERP